MKKKIIFVLTAAMLLISPVMLSSCGDEEENEPIQNNSGKNNGTNNNQQTVKEDSKYTVSYSSDFGVAPQSLTVKEGDKLTSGDLKPLDTDGYIFLGWYNGSNQVEEGFEVKQDLKLVAKWTKDGVVYANELKEFLAKKTDESKVYDVIILDLKPDMDVIVNALTDNPKVKINLNLEGCAELTEVNIVKYEEGFSEQSGGAGTGTGEGGSTSGSGGSSGGDIYTGGRGNDEEAFTNQSGGAETGTGEGGSTSGSGGGGRGNNVFLPNLVSLTIPNGVINIELSCDGLASLNIPNSVKGIYIYMQNPPAIRNDNTINVNCTIYVPASAVEIYKNADGWSKYAEQITTEQMNADTEITGTTGSGTEGDINENDGETRKQDDTYGGGSTFDF